MKNKMRCLFVLTKAKKVKQKIRSHLSQLSFNFVYCNLYSITGVLPRSVFHVKLLIYRPVRQIESNIANNTNKIKLSHE